MPTAPFRADARNEVPPKNAQFRLPISSRAIPRRKHGRGLRAQFPCGNVRRYR